MQNSRLKAQIFKSDSSGFTLIELLIAMSIFAVLAALGWQIFGQLQKTQDHVSIEAEKLEALQFAYMQINRDLMQYVNRVGHSNELVTEGTVAGDEVFSIGMDIYNNQMSFTRKATFDPRLVDIEGINHNPAFERVTIRLKDKQLIRYTSRDIDNATDKALPTVLLNDVTALRIQALDPAASSVWPPDETQGLALESITAEDVEPSDEQILQEATRIPLGVAISFEYKKTPVNWKFAMLHSLPSVPTPKHKVDKTKTKVTGKIKSKNTDNKLSEDEEPDR